MAKTLKIKKEFQETRVAFNGSGLPLGLRTDIHVLARIALDGGDDSLLNLFEETPTDEMVKDAEAAAFLEANPAESQTPAATPVTPVTPPANGGGNAANNSGTNSNSGDK